MYTDSVLEKSLQR